MHIFPQKHQSLHTPTGKRWELRCQGDAPPARVWPAVQPWRLRSVKSGGRIKEESKSVTVGFQTGSTGSAGGWRGCAIRGWSARVLADRARASDHKTPSKQSDGPNMSEEDVGGADAKLDWVMNSQQTFTRVPGISIKSSLLFACQKISQKMLLILESNSLFSWRECSLRPSASRPHRTYTAWAAATWLVDGTHVNMRA